MNQMPVGELIVTMLADDSALMTDTELELVANIVLREQAVRRRQRESDHDKALRAYDKWIGAHSGHEIRRDMDADQNLLPLVCITYESRISRPPLNLTPLAQPERS